MKRLLLLSLVLFAGIALAGTDVGTWTAFKTSIAGGTFARSQSVDMGDGFYVIVNRAVDKLCTGDCLAADGITHPDSSSIVTDGLRLWKTGEYSACSAACGEGEMSRSVTCVDASGDSATGCSDSNKPAATGPCTGTDGCFAWLTGEWSACASACTEASSQTRTVVCRRGDGTTAPDASCTDERPEVSRACASYAACVAPTASISGSTTTYTTAANIYTPTISGDVAACAWSFGDGDTGNGCLAQNKAWSAAGSYTVQLDMTGVNSLQTASASKAVTVWTKTAANFVVPTPLVAGIAANFMNTGTGDTASCAWNFGDTGTATVCNTAHTFTGATQRSVTLTVTGKGGDTSTKTLSATPITAAWESSTWSTCSPTGTCGIQSSQTRSVVCRGSDSQTLDDAYCAGAGTRPSEVQYCTDVSSCSYAWSTGAWSSCPYLCGGGTQTRSTTCLRNDGTTVADSYCSGAGTKPSTSQTCNTNSCYHTCYQAQQAGVVAATGSGWSSESISVYTPGRTGVRTVTCAGGSSGHRFTLLDGNGTAQMAAISGSSRIYHFLLGSGAWFRSPSTTVEWSWSSGTSVTGTWTAYGPTFSCSTSGVTPSVGVGCAMSSSCAANTTSTYRAIPTAGNSSAGTVTLSAAIAGNTNCGSYSASVYYVETLN
jgi:hypothetical protein